MDGRSRIVFGTSARERYGIDMMWRLPRHTGETAIDTSASAIDPATE